MHRAGDAFSVVGADLFIEGAAADSWELQEWQGALQAMSDLSTTYAHVLANRPSETARTQRIVAEAWLRLIPEGHMPPPRETHVSTARPASPSLPPGAIPGDGTFLVGADIQPGTYTTPGPTDDSAYWARLSGASGDLDEILANGNFRGSCTVTIKPTDVMFETSGALPWIRR